MRTGISTTLQKRNPQLGEIRDLAKVVQVEMAKPGQEHKSFAH